MIMTMPLRRLAMAFLAVGVLACAGCDTPNPAPSPSPLPAINPAKVYVPTSNCASSTASVRTVTITLDNDPASTRCRVDQVDPTPVDACVYDDGSVDSIEWRLTNKCKLKAKVQITNRRKLSAQGTVDEPFDSTRVFEETVNEADTASGNPGSELIDAEKLVNAAGVAGLSIKYKYDIAGDVTLDPEIDVRRGTGGGPPASPHPPPPPSPRH
jgi:hypothetical protein